MTYECGSCGNDNAFVNQCGCDPNNMPTRPCEEYDDVDRIYIDAETIGA